MLNKGLIEDTLNAALSTGGDFAEIFVEDRTNGLIELIGGKVESTTSGRDFGVGIRIYKGFNSVYGKSLQEKSRGKRKNKKRYEEVVLGSVGHNHTAQSRRSLHGSTVTE